MAAFKYVDVQKQEKAIIRRVNLKNGASAGDVNQELHCFSLLWFTGLRSCEGQTQCASYILGVLLKLLHRLNMWRLGFTTSQLSTKLHQAMVSIGQPDEALTSASKNDAREHWPPLPSQCWLEAYMLNS